MEWKFYLAHVVAILKPAIFNLREPFTTFYGFNKPNTKKDNLLWKNIENNIKLNIEYKIS